MRSKASARHSKLDFEVNIVPIIDCFTILITFMLAAGVYVSIGILDVGISQEGGQVQVQNDPDVSIAVELLPGREILLKVTGKESRESSIRMRDGKWDFDSLGEALAALKKKWSKVNSVMVEADPEIAYQDIIQAMEFAKRSHSEVLLGGF